jgi:hypothetical protein
VAHRGRRRNAGAWCGTARAASRITQNAGEDAQGEHTRRRGQANAGHANVHCNRGTAWLAAVGGYGRGGPAAPDRGAPWCAGGARAAGPVPPRAGAGPGEVWMRLPAEGAVPEFQGRSSPCTGAATRNADAAPLLAVRL